MTTFLTPLITQMENYSPLGGIVVILLLVILLIEDELVQGVLKRDHTHLWLTTFRVATIPLFFAFVLLMLARLVLLIKR